MLRLRMIAWPRLARDLPMDELGVMTSVVRLDELPELSSKILKGQIRSRTDVCAWALLQAARVFCYNH
jgi:acrylyl-CoA reductase (NADPH)